MKLLVTKKMFGERANYSATISNGEGDSKVTAYLDIQFKQGSEPSGTRNLISISADDCFFSCFKSKDTAKLKLVVMKHKVDKNYDNNEQAPQKQQPKQNTAEDTEGLPF